MGNASVRVEDLGLVCVGLGDELLELGDLANFFEGKDFILLVSVDSQTGTVVAPVFEPGSGRSWVSRRHSRDTSAPRELTCSSHSRGSRGCICGPFRRGS